MTYCIALRLDEGLVFLADTRTNAGVDNVSTYRKLHVFRPAADRIFVLESAGNLASTQQVLDRIEADLADPDGEGLSTVAGLADAAPVRRPPVQRGRRPAPWPPWTGSGPTGRPRFILGGQVGGDRPGRPPGLPGGQLHPGQRRPALPPDR